MRLSVLDLAPITEGATAADALRNSVALARHAEALGYHRYWLAEHHNMVGIASAATAVVIGHIAGATRTIRVGAGGIMLPNHSPLVIAEQFGTLASLYPARIDLGLGRAPGTDQMTLRALRRDPMSAERFPQDVMEVQGYFADPTPDQKVRAVPGAGLHVPVWILGSSTFGAQLAAALGLPYAFASHFAPADLMAALDIYRSTFRPSAVLDRPYVMLGVNVTAADSDAEGRRLFSSVQQQFTNMLRNARGRLQPPVADIDSYWTAAEKAYVERMLACAFYGSADAVGSGLREFIARTGADELMVTAHIYDHAGRLRSYEILAGLAPGLVATAA